MATSKYSFPYTAPGRDPNLTPLPHSTVTSIPENAEAVYLYSSVQDLHSQRATTPSFSNADGTEVGFTEKIPNGPGAKARIADWLKAYPDGSIVGFRTPAIKEHHHAAGPPVLTHIQRTTPKPP
jgi:hypothetical protein